MFYAPAKQRAANWHTAHKSKRVHAEQARSRCIGCVYINPSEDDPRTATVSYWVIADVLDSGLDEHLLAELGAWFRKGWPLDSAVFPFVDVLAELNAVTVTTQRADFTKLKKADLAGQQYLIGSDICFWDSLVKPLARLVNRALAAGVKRVVIADPGRPTFYEFCDMMAQKHDARLQEWYAIEPERFEGEVIDIRAK